MKVTGRRVVLARRAGGQETDRRIERPDDIAASDDGDHVRFAGECGVVARYDVVDGESTDHSAPGVEDVEGAPVVLCIDGEEVDHVRPVDC